MREPCVFEVEFDGLEKVIQQANVLNRPATIPHYLAIFAKW